MAKLTLLTIIITITAFCVNLVRVDEEARKNMKFRPFEFGFFIEGQQHRYEKQDERGIRMGQFGFITADGIYHVTVYATDENGKFKILAMTSQPYEEYLKTRDVTARQMTTTAPPITPAPRKPQTLFDFNSKACSGCSIRGEQVATEASNQETYKSDLTPLAIDPRISDGTSPTLHLIEKTLPRIFEEISENSFPRTLLIGGNNENINAPKSGFVGPIQNKISNREKTANHRLDRNNELGKLEKPSNSVFSPDQSTKFPILEAKVKPTQTTVSQIQRTIQEISENSFPRTLPIGGNNERVNAPKSGFVGPIQNKNLDRERSVNHRNHDLIKLELNKKIGKLEKSSSSVFSPDQGTKFPILGATKTPKQTTVSQTRKTSSNSFYSGGKGTQQTPTQKHRKLSTNSAQSKFDKSSSVSYGVQVSKESSKTQNTTSPNTLATFTQTPRQIPINSSSNSEMALKKYAASTPRINRETKMSTSHFESRNEGKNIGKNASSQILETSHRKQVSTLGNEASLKTLNTHTHTTQIGSTQHDTHFTLPTPTQYDENKTKSNPAKDNTKLGNTNPIASSTHIIPTTLKLPPIAILSHKSTRLFSDSITTSAKKESQMVKNTNVLSSVRPPAPITKPPKTGVSRPTQRTDNNQNAFRMSGEENRPNAIAKNDANVNDAGDLYRFKYILDYNGHTETGSTNGNKKGNYFIIGNDNMERVVEYIANENGFQPRIRWRKIEESKLKSQENSLKEYEFVWFNSGANH